MVGGAVLGNVEKTKVLVTGRDGGWPRVGSEPGSARLAKSGIHIGSRPHHVSPERKVELNGSKVGSSVQVIGCLYEGICSEHLTRYK